MSNAQAASHSSLKFWIVASLVLVLNAGLAASFWPVVTAGARAQSVRLTEAGKQARGSEAWLDFELAHQLDTRNYAASLALAKLQIASGQSQAAVASLRQAGEGREVLRLHLQTQLELGNTDQAVGLAQRLATASSHTQDDLLLASVALLASNRDDEARALAAHLTAPEVLQRVTAAQTDKVALARELLASGLVVSSEHLLMKQPGSTSRNLLLASLQEAHQSKEGLVAARDLYTEALSLDPTNRPARQGLIRMLKATGDSDGSIKQAVLLEQLDAGKL